MSVKVEWNPKDWEVKSKAVEKQLEPLVIHVTTLMNSEKSPKKRSGKSKKSTVLVSVLEKAIANFIQKGQQIADENPQVAQEMSTVIEEIRSSGKVMIDASRDFVINPCNTTQRSELIKSARALLTSVTRLLILADMIDVQILLKSTQSVEADLEKLRVVKSHPELEKAFKNFKLNAGNLLQQAAKRQHDLRDPQMQDDLAAARAILKKTSTMLLSATKVHISHSQIVEARENREEILRQVCQAVTTISKVAKGDFESESGNNVGKLAWNLEKFQQIDKCVSDKITLEEQLDEIIKGAQLISGTESVRNERKEKILAGCQAIREALQGLFTKMDPKEASKLGHKTKTLKRQLCKAVADQITTVFHPTHDPLLSLYNAAKTGDLAQVEVCTSAFTQHCSKLIEVAHQVCELSTNEDGVKMVRHAASLLENLQPQVVNSARILAQQPQSVDALENMDMFKNEWLNQVKILLEAVDDVTTVDDVLSVLENYILDDMNQCLGALHDRNPGELCEIVANIQNRTKRICEMVASEMDNYEPCLYTRKVLQAVKVLNERVKDFETKTEAIIQVMRDRPEEELDENDFIDTTRLIYDGVREVRRAVLMNRADEDLDPEEVEIEENYTTDITRTQTVEENSDDMGGINVVRQAINTLPEKDKRKIMQQVENFQSEKLTFDQEVTKWDDAGNDIVVLAKYMGMIMIQMTDFVRQKGPLKTTTDVINAAKKISETGNKLDKLTRQIAEQCPESTTKKDLLAYLERVALYSHQINIIAKVKADVQSANNEELILAGVESATSLIENAKNLMNAVVLTVKASYVATTKYTRTGTNIQSPIVVWKMKIPEKKPLVRLEKPKEVRAVVRKGSQRVPQHPIKALAEFEL
ncbi:Catenin alpha-like Protein [Tribolium castaneum]|uniref:Catenin alpha-like Protein n=2 Tax=Tribolium castaneum TaxID=7070 RepID=D6WCC8_TRICA|nr:PREDICTED: catenin alpha [Tribolium castaneum]EEZ98796.1 Catenin alpha-like Protein [Tribolium castaneum]|eukprot:XP_001813244.1 PREDICTED: catenin alpha [Tribolium castaneum]